MGKKNWLTVYDYLFIVLGNLSFAFGVVGFLQPVNISPGGLTGIAAIFNYLFSLPTGAMLFLLNLPLLIVGFIKLGGRTIFRTMISTVLSSVSIDVMTVFIKPISDDKIICALAAGVLMGAGMAMMFFARRDQRRHRYRRKAFKTALSARSHGQTDLSFGCGYFGRGGRGLQEFGIGALFCVGHSCFYYRH